MQTMVSKGSNNQQRNNGGGGGGGNNNTNRGPWEWQMKKKGDKIVVDQKTWWWCPDHNKGKGMYVRHKPENHAAWKNSGSKKTYVDKDE